MSDAISYIFSFEWAPAVGMILLGLLLVAVIYWIFSAQLYPHRVGGHPAQGTPGQQGYVPAEHGHLEWGVWNRYLVLSLMVITILAFWFYHNRIRLPQMVTQQETLFEQSGSIWRTAVPYGTKKFTAAQEKFIKDKAERMWLDINPKAAGPKFAIKEIRYVLRQHDTPKNGFLHMLSREVKIYGEMNWMEGKDAKKDTNVVVDFPLKYYSTMGLENELSAAGFAPLLKHDPSKKHMGSDSLFIDLN